MFVAYWNVRGCARKNALLEAMDFYNHNKVKIFMLCEVKSHSSPSQAMISKCGFQ